MATARKKCKTTWFLLCFVFDSLLLLCVVLLMNHVKALHFEDVRLNLTEVASQARDVIEARLELEAHILTLMAHKLSSGNELLQRSPDKKLTSEDWRKVLEQVAERESSRYFVADMDGNATMQDYAPFSVKGRTYFRKALSDGPNFSSRLIFRFNGESGIVLSAPLAYHEKVVGTLQKTYSLSQFFSMAVPSIFSSRGEISIISQQGNLLISSEEGEHAGNIENYFRNLYETGNHEASNTMEKDLLAYRSGIVEASIHDKDYFVVYVPIDAVAGWSLVFRVTQETVFQHATLVMRIFYGILLTLLFVFSVSLAFFVREKRREHSRLEQVAFVDNVTGGNTYSKFMVDAQSLFDADAGQKKYSILSFDIDSFKYVNSHYGFEVGDDILRLVNRSVTSKLHTDELMGHVSGDRFVALLQDASPEHVKDLLAPVDTPHGVTLHFSGGLYRVKDNAESIKLMVDKATLASKEVKGKFHEYYANYSDELDQRLLHAERLKQELQDALAKGEIIPYFQPKIDIDTGRLVGAEALARWRKSDGSLVPPGDFIPISEKTGLVMEIDKAILASVLKFIRLNLDKGGCGAPISSNFSRMHLLDIKFPQNIIATLSEHGIPTRYFEVELTESTFYSTNKRIAELVSTLRNAGVHVSMDDFGSGYSSLNMLKDIPINVLKIDQGFLQQTNNTTRRDIIFAAVVKMAQELGIDVVVEGVETRDDVELMRRFGCHVAQGYYYSKPISPEEFAPIYIQGHM